MNIGLEVTWRKHRTWILIGLDIFEFDKQFISGWMFTILFLRVLKLHVFLYARENRRNE